VGEAGGAYGSGPGFDGGLEVVELDVAADSGFEAGEAEIEAGGVFVGEIFAGELGGGVTSGLLLDLGVGEEVGVGGAVVGEGVHPGAAGVGKAEELGDLVVGFAGCVVKGFADVAVVPGLLRRAGGEVEVGVAAADDEGE